ncbi:Putative nucleotidyltransferase/DNA polymerase involved in DNA repair [gamma proteobacterium HdN1]|nr:Putative nucleotidyltransferase/DNA polymerase involved in DNA repair [gamma proteobacterium HdN1]
MLWICVHFPQLALDVFHPASDMPVAIETRRQVWLATETARASGVRSGISIPSALGMCPTLQVRLRDPALEQRTLARTALLAYQFTPHITQAEPDCVLLEVQSSLRLFGSCEALLAQLQQVLAAEDLHYTLACFPTARGAIVLARSALELNQAGIFPLEALDGCPLSASELPATQIDRLQGMGLDRLGQLFALPSAALGKRLGQGSLLYLQQLRGLHPDLRPHYSPPPSFESDLEFGHEVEHQEALLFPLKRLLNALTLYLHARQQTATSVQLHLRQRDGSQEMLQLTPAQATLRAEILLDLFRLRLERFQIRQPIVALKLVCDEFQPWKPIVTDLFDTQAAALWSPQALVDHLQARLGNDFVSGLRPLEDYRPERSWQVTPPGQPHEIARTLSTRPLWLLATPRALACKNGLPCDPAPLTLLQGPERIDSGWWDQAPVKRDYFIARHSEGMLYWIFRPLAKNELEHTQPQWFLHGVFG